MRLLSINLGRPELLQIAQQTTTTGIYKNPIETAQVSTLGLSGDHVADQEHHGGPDQAVYVYSAEDYDWWMEKLGQALEPGTFGENLTFSSYGQGPVRIGDRFRVGPVLLEVSAPRIPCATLAARMGDPNFVKKFRQAARPGFYARVLEEGQVRHGQSIEKIAAPAQNATLLEVFDLWYDKTPDAARLRWILTAPLAERARAVYAERLKSIEAL
ncbi:MAG: molybdenum cofactor biosynthesis protein [Meiothermus sp.]|uniref:Molybdenum cofactor biosysynthesis protein n=2 Tax=Meiothermus hypogaeus TaxID=884155 RepID=A0A511QZG2_9DEIN|nr:MOSC domain-containing protein [Meiothermus hypogaeus]RIH79441.1 MOSC domain protein [Meiothermus hypogaeus]GEM82738.1 molybdenum cofactor biosysynthesis protein [Meiothermus hypogaeus NBRC 106114]GIW38055.1 MAG: molybdenum cofactor biosynthesis protein [Meiothermus sp.]